MIKLSAIIFVRNGRKFISKNVASLKAALEGISHEIIVSDNKSTDGTIEYLLTHHPDVVIVNSSNERSRQVNEAARLAKGQYIYMTGVDILYNPDYFIDCINIINTKNAKAIYTSVITEDEGYIAAIKKFERDLYIGDDFHESARLVKKDLFLKIGGYDEDIVAGEDYDFQRRINLTGEKTYRSGFIAERHLSEEKNLIYVFKRAFYYGKTLNRFFQKNGARGVIQMSPIRLNYFSGQAVRHPVLLFGLFLYKTTQLFGGLSGIIYSIFKK